MKHGTLVLKVGELCMGVNCFKCQYFRVTWDQNNPRGCAAYQFKSKQLPSIVVKKSSGIDCMQFSPKKTQEVRRG